MALHHVTVERVAGPPPFPAAIDRSDDIPDDQRPPQDIRLWLGRGRSYDHAARLAHIWQMYPDLPFGAPLEDRMARGRERIAAMRPLNDEISALAEAERQATNFAFQERRVKSAECTDQDIAILNGRDLHGYDWDIAVTYASGWYAAHAGYDYHFYPSGSGRDNERRAAYNRGFMDAGGQQHDLFDAARRAHLAAIRTDNQPRPEPIVVKARPLPSTWPKPSDHSRPTRWSRRVLITADAALEEITPGLMRVSGLKLLDEVKARAGTSDMTIITIDRHGGFVRGLPSVEHALAMTASEADAIIADRRHGATLRDLLSGHEIDDILIAVQGDYLRVMDAYADALPLCNSMARTRNSLLQQRSHLRCWLDRGHDGSGSIGAGHIRWGKAINGLTGKLGEFTARHTGPAPRRGHLIQVQIDGGRLATGYADCNGRPLPPELVVSNKSNIRREMATLLRSFGGATLLMDVAR